MAWRRSPATLHICAMRNWSRGVNFISSRLFSTSDHTQYVTAADDRCGQNRIRVEGQLTIHVSKETLVGERLIDERRFSILDHPTRHALAGLQATPKEVLGLDFALHQCEDEFIGLVITNQQRTFVRMNRVESAIEDPLQYISIKSASD